ncbi:hypothetical protein MTR67_009088 [Solanum verrucosum]|uniref:Isopenicillin N synthase-like Fe(2+) 2OG dioxygenase domain-containing protein n=1 Tax=Solanum verrucosum TaxID=315347 RepID=A0AAF0Q399_SOLVR|nr:hypothetical protein MTR67_009088 [Solanum verrucosum]
MISFIWMQAVSLKEPWVCAEKARIEAELKAAEVASRRKAEADLKLQRERQREAARIALQKIVSNGVYRSIEHRAIVNSNKERLSVATFYSSNLDSELGPAHSLTGPNNPPIFRKVPVDKYFKDFFARKLDGKSYLIS